jgi:hypothetical protein
MSDDEEVVELIVHDPGGVGFRIERVWAFLAVGDDDDEGIMAAHIGGTWMPLIAADRDRLESLRPYAEMAAAISGKGVELVCFEQRVFVERLR